ncbi:metallopeptidase family protein [Ruicaihuangia caeni]|uniref:Metallopeptidase family protein n=1 Tax=Ruicaihuangia caeni TaxID=3042517 RepID=A0AAW6T8K6_9MICO|nr:metallopeptidase family protein [Klugiella sp. YN-L-19]MDI2099436.1 metallopeptidase family protein [Klugiella sp. YN-L-19]
MPRTRHAAARRNGRRDRHRGIRSSVAGPFLPPLNGRVEFFDLIVASTADYLRGVFPGQLEDVRFEVAALPEKSAADRLERWRVYPRERRIVLYRLPIQRMTKLHRNDDWHRRAVIESCVFHAVAELLGRDPWEISPDRFHHF